MNWWIWVLIVVPWTPILLMLCFIIKKINKLNKDIEEKPLLYVVEDTEDLDNDDGTWH